MPNETINEHPELHEEQELRALLVRVLEDPLKVMTENLRQNTAEALADGLKKAKNNALQDLTESLKPTIDCLEGLSDLIKEWPDIHNATLSAATAQLDAKIDGSMKDAEERLSAELQGKFTFQTTETEKQINIINEQLNAANGRLASTLRNVFVVGILNFIALIVLIIVSMR